MLGDIICSAAVDAQGGCSTGGYSFTVERKVYIGIVLTVYPRLIMMPVPVKHKIAS